MDGESQNMRDARIEKLWQTLDTKREGQLDLNGLRKGLREIHHPLKDAEDMLRDILKVVDTSGDGVIQYSEFRAFVEHTEKELWRLFKSIDRNNNGQLDKNELQEAFRRAGILIPKTKLDQFFAEVDTNHDGVISFDEWRNFLLFVPANSPGLRAVLSYYSSTVTVNADADVHVSDESKQGLGNEIFTALFGTFTGALTALLKCQDPPANPPRPASPLNHEPNSEPIAGDCHPNTFPWDPGDKTSMQSQHPLVVAVVDENIAIAPKQVKSLTAFLPDPGYFVAGGIAGVVSRTATAPLDRLKVFLISQTSVRHEAIHAAKSGAPVQAAKAASGPLVEATKELWRMGGIRSMFAGNGINVVKVMPESAVKFGSYEGAKRLLAKAEGHDDPKGLQPWSQFLAAGLGGIISQFLVYPLDTLKFRTQNETSKGSLQGNALIAATAKKMWRIDGVRAFYKGLPFGLIGMFPYSAIDLTTFEYLKQFVTTYNASKRKCGEEDAAPGNVMTASIGAVSGAFGASVVYPINVLRTRLQSQGTIQHPPTYTGMWDVTAKTFRGEGIRGMFKGITPNLLKVVPAVSITYVVYDNSKRALGLR